MGDKSILTGPTIELLLQMKTRLDLATLCQLAHAVCRLEVYHVKSLEGTVQKDVELDLLVFYQRH